MFNVENGIRSLTEFKQNSTDILSDLKKNHEPIVLTVNGRAEVVLIDPKSYQKMMEKLYLADSARRIEERLRDSQENQGMELDEFFNRVIDKHTKNKPKNDKKI